MQIAQLPAEIRNQIGKGPSKRLRLEGRVPASVYGKEYKARSIHVAEKDVEKILQTRLGMNTLVELVINGADKPKVLIKEMKGHPVTRRLFHLDFYVVHENQKVQVRVPIKLTGRSIGVHQGGILEQLTREVELMCPVNLIPEEIIVDITELNIGKNIHLSAIRLPQGVELQEKYDPALVTVIDPKKLEALEQAKAAEAAAAAAAQAVAAAPVAGAAIPTGAPAVVAPGTVPAAVPGAAPAAAGAVAPTDKKAHGKK